MCCRELDSALAPDIDPEPGGLECDREMLVSVCLFVYVGSLGLSSEERAQSCCEGHKVMLDTTGKNRPTC